MSSENDEGGEPLDNGSMKSDAEKSDSSSPKKSVEHAKPRRRGRRGKKRKQRKESGDSQPSGAAQLRSDMSGTGDVLHAEASGSGACSSTDVSGSRVNSESETRGHLDIEPSFDTDSPWDSNEELETTEAETFSGQVIRPNAPHAPKNSTQFIIDDHNECRLYMSFETPNPYLISGTTNDGSDLTITEPIGEDAAYIDIDYQYESPQDFDNTAYYDREFELSYKSNRFEELLRLPREELISGLQVLESRLKDLSDDLVKENPSPILEKLQSDLLELQEKHLELKEANTKLTALVMQNEKTAERWTKPEQQTDVKNEDSHLEGRKSEGSMEVSSDENRLASDGSGGEIETQLCGTHISNAKQDFSPEQVDCDSSQEQTVQNSDAYRENNGLDPLPRQVESEEMRAATV